MKLLSNRLGIGTIATTSGAVLIMGLSGCGGQASAGGASTPTPTTPVIEGKWVADDPDDAFLKFDKPDKDNKGHVKGGDGCNGVQGDYTLKGNKVTIKRGFGTLKGCPGVDDWLRKVQAVEINGDTLTVQNGKGKEIGTLTRDS